MKIVHVVFIILVSQTLGDTPVLPFLFGRGFDIVLNDIRFPIIEPHFSNNVWTSTGTNQTFLVAEQAVPADNPSEIMTQSSYHITTFEQFQEMSSSWHSMGWGIPGVFAFSEGSLSVSIQNGLAVQDKQVYLVQKVFTFYEVASWPFEVLDSSYSSHFWQMITDLPPTRITQDEKDQYTNIITTFGTHWFPGSDQGGIVYYTFYVASSLVQQMSSVWVASQVTAYASVLDIKFGMKNTDITTTTKVNEKFVTSMQVQCTWVGGQGTLDGPCDSMDVTYPTWLDTISRNPIPVYPALFNYTDLITDVAVKKNMIDAIHEYVNTAPKNHVS